MPEEIKNYGVILGQKPTDYIVGVNSPLPYEVRVPDANWKKYCPPGEWQRNNKIDYMACVTFSALNSIEAQELLQTGKQPNYSDRWIAKMSGTTPQGNYLYKVVDAIREFGLVLEEDYPTSPDMGWEEYMADIPEPKLTELKAKGQEWLKTHQVNYEWLTNIDASIDYHLKHAPLQIAMFAPSHAVVDVYSPTDVQEYFDSYEPWFKNTPLSNVAAVLKIILTMKGEAMPEFKVQNYKGELRLIFDHLCATDMEDWKNICKVFDVDPNKVDEEIK